MWLLVAHILHCFSIFQRAVVKTYFGLTKFLPKTSTGKVDLLNNQPRLNILNHISEFVVKETNQEKVLEMRSALDKMLEEIWKEEKNHRVANFRRIWLRGMWSY